MLRESTIDASIFFCRGADDILGFAGIESNCSLFICLPYLTDMWYLMNISFS